MTKRQDELEAVIDGTFDAGFLVDESGAILSFNQPATELFRLEASRSTEINIEHCLEFSGSLTVSGSSWKDVMHQLLVQQINLPDYEATGLRGGTNTFPVRVKMTVLHGEQQEGIYVLIFLRPVQEEFIVRKAMNLSRENQGETTSTIGGSTKSIQLVESLMTAIVEASLDPLFQISESGIIQMVNRAAVQKFGWRRSELVGSNISIICGGGHGSNHNEYIQNYLKTGVTKVIGKQRELPARRKDGSQFPIELAVSEVETFTGDERLFCGYVHDLTSRKRKQSLLAGMIEASLDPMFQINERGIIHMVNEASLKLFGWSREEFLGSNISMICGGGHANNHNEYIARYLETGITKVIGKERELPARRKDGSEFPIELGVAEVKTEEGQERLFCGYVHDLTSRKRKENLLAGTIEASLDPMFQINERGHIQMANKAAVQLFGWRYEEFIGNNISMITGGNHAAHHDEYMQRYLRTGEARVIGKKRELPARKKDGTEFPIELGVVEIRTDSREERRFCGFVRDLTGQKEDEKELKRREDFTNRIIESSYNALFVTDCEGSIHRVNSTAINIFGWGREEFHHKNFADIIDPKVAAEFNEELRQFVTAGVTLSAQREVDAIKKDGSTFPIMMGVSDVEGPHGATFLAIEIADLTDKKKMLEIQIEKTATEMLLMNVLPESIANRLRDDPHHIAEHHQNATMLFADIVGFTSMSSGMKPQDVVSMLNQLFTVFDELVEKYDLNKVKTIGDCYMVTSVPVVEHEENECCRVCHFAMDMIEALGKYNRENPDKHLNLRVGINAGPVVAGVVGTKRFLYDLWGDAVNLASRMESTGIPGRIQVTQEVVNLVGDSFQFESRGEIHVKGKGEMEVFLIKGRKRQPSSSMRSSPGSKRKDHRATTLAALLQDSTRHLDFDSVGAEDRE